MILMDAKNYRTFHILAKDNIYMVHVLVNGLKLMALLYLGICRNVATNIYLFWDRLLDSFYVHCIGHVCLYSGCGVGVRMKDGCSICKAEIAILS